MIGQAVQHEWEVRFRPVADIRERSRIAYGRRAESADCSPNRFLGVGQLEDIRANKGGYCGNFAFEALILPCRTLAFDNPLRRFCGRQFTGLARPRLNACLRPVADIRR